MDVQAVKLSPHTSTSVMYYRTKLKVHNFTVLNIGSQQCTCYWWHEAGLDASVFTSLIIAHLEEQCTDSLPVIFWSDGCGYQNRNNVLSNALLSYAVKHDKKVEQKYLSKGHTQMEADHIHSMIEKKLKNRDIHLPFDYVKITQKARKNPMPIDTKYLDYKFFKKYDDSALLKYSSIRPGRFKDDPTVSDLKHLLYNPDGIIQYKIDFNDELKILPHRTKKNTSTENVKPLYDKRLAISTRKYNDIQAMKEVLPSDVMAFYDNLEHV